MAVPGRDGRSSMASGWDGGSSSGVGYRLSDGSSSTALCGIEAATQGGFMLGRREHGCSPAELELVRRGSRIQRLKKLGDSKVERRSSSAQSRTELGQNKVSLGEQLVRLVRNQPMTAC